MSDEIIKASELHLVSAAVRGDPIENKIVLPALVDFVEPVLDIVVGHHQTLNPVGGHLILTGTLRESQPSDDIKQVRDCTGVAQQF